MLRCRQLSILHVHLALQLPSECLVRQRHAGWTRALCSCTPKTPDLSIPKCAFPAHPQTDQEPRHGRGNTTACSRSPDSVPKAWYGAVMSRSHHGSQTGRHGLYLAEPPTLPVSTLLPPPHPDSARASLGLGLCLSDPAFRMHLCR